MTDDVELGDESEAESAVAEPAPEPETANVNGTVIDAASVNAAVVGVSIVAQPAEG